MNVNEFPREYLKAVNFLKDFFNESGKWNVDMYIGQCKILIRYLEMATEEEIKNWKLAYTCNKDLLYIKGDFAGENDEKQVVRFTALVYHSYAFKERISMEGVLYAEQINRIGEVVEDYYFDKLRRAQPYYYKNFLDEKYFADYESILSMISSNLKMYDMNLEYCKKIVDFLTNEFDKNGSLVMQTIFLKNYLSNAVDSMILTICKMIFDNPDMKNKRNCGLRYLQAYIGKNLSQDSRELVQEELKQVSDKIKEVKKMTTELEDLRNSLIAHFDIDKIESVKQVKMRIEEFEKVFELLCEILELLSMKYFLYENTFSYKMISIHGFKYFVCQNPLLHNDTTDLDVLLDTLRKEVIM